MTQPAWHKLALDAGERVLTGKGHRSGCQSGPNNDEPAEGGLKAASLP